MKPNTRPSFRPLLYGGLLMMAFTAAQLAQAEGGIATDITSGAVQTLSLLGDTQDVTIKQDYGKTIGNNLFHSFDQFNINTGQTVTFTENTVNSLNNVISRVTGGSSSDINGKLISTPDGHANFYLINPAGIVFGKDAQLDVAGAFHASTANQMTFSDGAVLNADKSQISSLSMATPAAFGFLVHTAANNGLLRVDGATLAVEPGQTLDLVGGEIKTDNATLNAPGGEVRLVAMQGAGEVSLRHAEGVLPLPQTMPSSANAGTITLQDTFIKTTGDGGGRIGVWGGNVAVSSQVPSQGQGLNAINTGSLHAALQKGIEMKIEHLTLNGARVRTEAQGSGNAGDIKLQSSQDTVLLAGGRIASVAQQDSTGNTGNVRLSVGSDLILNGQNTPEKVFTSIGTAANANSTGNDGDVNILVGRNVSISNGSQIYSNTNAGSKGNTGNVNVNAQGNILVTEGSEISSLILTKGNAGILTVAADGNITVGGRIKLEAQDGEGNAAAGRVTVSAKGDLNVTPEGEIASKTFANRHGADVNVNVGKNLWVDGSIYTINAEATGNSGDVLVHADGDITLNGNGSRSNGYISSLVADSGKGSIGNIDVSANGKLTLLNRGHISTITLNDASNAGNVTVNVQGDILLNNISFISTDTQSKANAGNVNIISGGNLTVSNGFIASSTAGEGVAGNVAVDVKGNLNLNKGGIRSGSLAIDESERPLSGTAGNVTVHAQGNILVDSSYIDASTYGRGQGGKVNVTTAGDLLVRKGAISSYTEGAGSAGDVQIHANNILLDRGFVFSDSNGSASSGQTGQIRIVANKGIVLSNLSGINIGNEAVLTESAAKAITPGTISLTAQDIHVTDSLITTDASGNAPAGNIAINFSHWLQETSSFIHTTAATGNGGAITIKGGELLSLRNADIVTTVAGGQGNGGSINVDTEILLMDTGSIQANAASGNGGEINLNLKALIPSGDSLIIGGAKVALDVLTPNFNVIQAVSETGVSGIPNVTAPQLNIVGALAGLNTPELDLNRVGRDPCSETMRHSSLKKLGKGGVPMFNKGQDSYTIDHLLDTETQDTANTQHASQVPNEKRDCKPKPAEQPIQQAKTE